MLSPKVKHFIFRHSMGSLFNYKPGQFITFHFNHQGRPVKRSYSIANIPAQHNLIEIAATHIEGGPGTTLLYQLKPGDTLTTSGPYGRLLLKDTPPKRYILVATSTGITPYRAMFAEFEQLLAHHPDLHINVLEGVQRRSDLLYADEFLALAKKHPRFHFHACFSREESIGQFAYEHQGHVQNTLLELNLDPENDVIYLCGNPAMIDETFDLLKNKGFSTQHIIREKYLSR